MPGFYGDLVVNFGRELARQGRAVEWVDASRIDWSFEESQSVLVALSESTIDGGILVSGFRPLPYWFSVKDTYSDLIEFYRKCAAFSVDIDPEDTEDKEKYRMAACALMQDSIEHRKTAAELEITYQPIKIIGCNI